MSIYKNLQKLETSIYHRYMASSIDTKLQKFLDDVNSGMDPKKILDKWNSMSAEVLLKYKNVMAAARELSKFTIKNIDSHNKVLKFLESQGGGRDYIMNQMIGVDLLDTDKMMMTEMILESNGGGRDDEELVRESLTVLDLDDQNKLVGTPEDLEYEKALESISVSAKSKTGKKTKISKRDLKSAVEDFMLEKDLVDFDSNEIVDLMIKDRKGNHPDDGLDEIYYALHNEVRKGNLEIEVEDDSEEE